MSDHVSPDIEAARKKAKNLKGATTVRAVRWGFYADGAGSWVCVECQGVTRAKSSDAVCDCWHCGSNLQDGKGRL